jgi:uncharacterized repeat protein (TIGR03803 family)
MPLNRMNRLMKNKRRQRGISWIRRSAANTTFALAIALLIAVVATQPAQAQTFTTLHSFDGTDGSGLYTGLVQATDGDLYGVTYFGGVNNQGTVFKITLSGTLTTLYSFCSQAGCTDGAGPGAGLIQATNGNFYGTTASGGAYGDGTVFEITPTGTLTTLHSFDGADGNYPAATLVQAASDGKFYGTTANGGANESCDSFGLPGCGTLFSITPGGELTTLYNFCSQGDCTDGTAPFAGLVQAANGNLYGTTTLGGASDAGTVFEITPSGTLTTLHSFDYTDGNAPQGALVQGKDGNFYGTTRGGGASGDGTAFKVTPTGTLTSLHSFDGTDGANPTAGLVQAADGNFYGTTESGEANIIGTIFKITPSGTLTTLQDLVCTSGCFPYAGLVQDTNGSFYGTTLGGGTDEMGVIFSLSVGLRAFVETQPSYGKVGATIRIQGTDLTGATSVTFNGTAATFVVVASSEITTTVPSGATTGKVQVVTPSGTLSSNLKFRVVK